MRSQHLLVILSLFFLQKFYCTVAVDTRDYCASHLVYNAKVENSYVSGMPDLSTSERPNPLLRHFYKKQNKHRRLTAAILAFPLPFGIVGLHRIYLGSAPYVPVAYIASLGGALGLLPFIDFCVILADKNTETYVNNKKVFMWVN